MSLEDRRQSDTELVVGLDIGGANLKLADTQGAALDRAFALWRSPDKLTDQLVSLLAAYPLETSLAVTMTGELADCFADAAAGVRFIADAVVQAAPHSRSIDFYGVDGNFAPRDIVHLQPDRFAASNWHALAQYLAESVSQATLLIDIGSTTCDLIPLLPGRVATESRSDFDRLAARELLYFGIGRTPICAIVDRLPFEGRDIPVMNEWFATTGDCAVVLGMEAEDETDRQTADGKPRTVHAATARLARMIGLDRRRFTRQHATQCSHRVLSVVREKIMAAISAAPAADGWILSGHGQTLLDDAVPPEVQSIDLSKTLGSPLSRVAPAYAVAKLHAAGGHRDP